MFPAICILTVLSTTRNCVACTHTISFPCPDLYIGIAIISCYHADSSTTAECDEICPANPPLSGIVWKNMADYLAGDDESFWTDGHFPTVIGEEPMHHGNAYFWNIYVDEAPQQLVMGVCTSKAVNWLQVLCAHLDR